MTTPINRNRRNTALGVTAGLLGGGAIGLIMAVPTLTNAATDSGSDVSATVVQDDSGTDPTGTPDTGTPDPSDSDPGDSEQMAPGRHLRDLLQELVDDGTLTSAQADAVAEHLIANRPERGDHGRHHRGPNAAFDGEVLAGLLGIDVETLRSELRAGKTVAEIATEQGVDVATVIAALVDEAESHLELSVENGRLTQEEADARLADITERITDRINNGGGWRGH